MRLVISIAPVCFDLAEKGCAMNIIGWLNRKPNNIIIFMCTAFLAQFCKVKAEQQLMNYNKLEGTNFVTS